MVVLIVVAGLLAIVIQYNLTNINIAERIRELSTIKVLGFYDNEVTMYIYRETILLTVIGILVGYLTGDLLYRYILYVVPPDNVMFNPALSTSQFSLATGSYRHNYYCFRLYRE
ncbi:ABC transporter permease [Lactobacillus sp. R2/2]|nr:ABC transporter permease [Lactobacillus sp. R2/2]